MDSSSKSEEFYNKLRSQLYETSSWPTEYLYKFIVKSNSEKLAKLEAIFDNMGAVINTVESKNGNYTSVSVNLLMRDPSSVIEKYKEVAEKIEGVISL
ncbi:DUF493 family protein [Seonamhaeicola aphaedonensis]|uniref:DUF493 family protein n=1 Tax=Seonamhaeicola aphaedonensis TaxID=1461338 RepID=A0A3D9HDR8_9FLAO|nr:DUF493 family protein [Seonamhaeicola aphaedonensis]RED47615.1 hypothetical protein DFQ02_106243 [Seonamhaeicola aphaedonensis]